MSAPTNAWDPGAAWAPYTPTPDAPWDLRRVVHLRRRAGFAAPWADLQRDLADGPERSVTRLLEGRARAEGVPDGLDLADPGELRSLSDLRGWWLRRMLLGPDPLGERLTLLWHNHFATSNAKVRDVGAMHRQNELLRRLARAPFGDLLGAAVHDPALLVWLDGSDNRKGRPNENLARELMELFTLGVGRYTETDVKEAARALTGWKVTAEGEFAEWPPNHDDGKKTVLGHLGRWDGDDVVRILLEHPATAERLAWRLCDLLMGEGTVDDPARAALAAGLSAHRLDVGWGVGTVLRSHAFFASANIGSQVLGPVEHVVGAVRALGLVRPAPSGEVLGEWAALLGQDLFQPPNVGGWPGGRAWLTTQGLVGRANYAAALAAGELWAGGTAPDLLALAQRHGSAENLDAVLAFFSRLLTGAEPEPGWRRRLLAGLGPGARPGPATVGRLVAWLLASPELSLA
jgi:uncharacterized protein (DUF1800 family)